MKLKDVLGEIESDGANLVHGRLLKWALTPPLWHAEAVGGVHTIRPPKGGVWISSGSRVRSGRLSRWKTTKGMSPFPMRSPIYRPARYRHWNYRAIRAALPTAAEPCPALRR